MPEITGFTPASAAVGGALIGLAAVLFMALNGRIAGVSGVVAGVMAPLRGEGRADLSWRLAFIIGLFLAPLAAGLALGRPVEIAAPHPLWMMALGGLLVGYGTRLGSGCTSGHGVCGIARLSKRSFAATAMFMASAILTVFILHRLFGV
ncbi:MAG: YeeE/YedE family protein [Parvularculaceae bacterium]